jgi:dTDP-4-amino-4,6-dideoxygalactose transaminase
MVSSVPLLDLGRQYAVLKDKLDSAVLGVMVHGKFILGPEVKRFEQEAAKYVGVKHAIGVASGTDALLLALRAVGVNPGDEVIVPAFSFFASAGVISRLCAEPKFVDIDPETYNIDPAKLETAITPKTKAVMPVHLFGQCADMKAVMEIARRHKVAVIEDAAQALSSRYDGTMAGAIGDIGCFSFFPTKNLGGVGDGGMVTTDNDELAATLRKLRVHGAEPKYYHQIVGYNSRLDTIQAAALSVKLPHLDEWSEARRSHASVYDRELKGLPIELPVNRSYGYHIYNQYTLGVDRREAFREHLKSRQIGHEVYYPVPLHLQECYKNLGQREGSFPVSERAAKRVCSLPIFPELRADEQAYVVQAVRDFVSK